MLGLNGGELSLVILLIFAVVSAKFWPAAGASIAQKLMGTGRDDVKSERTKDRKST